MVLISQGLGQGYYSQLRLIVSNEGIKNGTSFRDGVHCDFSSGILMKNTHQSIGLLLVPIVFVLLWSGGYAVAKVGIKYAEPMTLLVWRYILVVVLLVPFYLVLKPPLPKRRIDWVK